MKLIYCLLAILWPAINTHAQNPLRTGDTLPNINFTNVLNYKSPSAKLSDFQGKLIIFDFWNTTCAPCVAALPKMDSLQKKYATQIQIIPVTYQTATVAQTFLQRRWPGNKALQLPFIVSDTLLSSLVLYGAVPHEVWIDGNGIIKSFTDHRAVTEQNIEAMLAGRPINAVQKQRFQYHPAGTPLVIDEQTPALYRSLLTFRTQNAKGSGSAFINNNSQFMLYAYAFPFKKLLIMAFGRQQAFSGAQNRVLWNNQSTDTLYNYEVIIPVGKDSLNKQALMKRARSIMQRDLNNYLSDLYHVTATLTTQKTKCLAITIADKNNPTFKTEGKSEILVTGTNQRTWRNQPLPGIFKEIASLSSNYSNGSSPIILNETGYTGTINLTVDQHKLSTLEDLQSQLSPQGFTVYEVTRDIEIIIIN